MQSLTASGGGGGGGDGWGDGLLKGEAFPGGVGFAGVGRGKSLLGKLGDRAC